ncbi:hypothetical protein BCR35DRAFT_323738 [Leucosporidium creatinivorum]|uniref:Zn(2)-C6 fungal-type domain-containing protein n=1 Tax=Leucosporidium creatinivorum TaxID=106004 RepID=A0A1Y2G109_9BASI|nr:hypothetical protein BCR35DRAFT_323738 [Leucosporidium creatinivorum]
MPADPSEKTLKKKKPPSCDRCKAKRVLCHPAPPGESCPRCLENEVPCTTTPVVRRRPVRKPATAPSTTNNSASPDAQPLLVPPHLAQAIASGSRSETTSPQAASPESLAVLTSSWAQAPGSLDELPRELLISLFNDFRRSPQSNHPALPYTSLRKSLESLQWRISLLAPDLRALTYCILASAALISLHPLILGPGPIPATPQELDSWPATTDWSSFGRRRQEACRALREAAFRLSKEAEVTTESSACNAASCYILDFLMDNSGATKATSRPYATAYMAHARSLAESQPEGELGQPVRWATFMAGEAVRATQAGAPILFSTSDQMMLHGDDNMSVEQLETMLSDKSTMREQQPIFASLRPYGIYVIEIARQIDDNISGAFARRRPLSDKTLTSCLTSINRLGVLYTHLSDRLHLQRPTPHFSFFPPIVNIEHDLQAILQSVRVFYALGYSAAVLSLHSELERRARVESQPAAGETESAVERRERERVELVRRQVRDMAREAAREWARASGDLPSVAHATHVRFLNTEHWALVLLEEVRETGVLSLENARALESILFVLKITGFSNVDPSLQPLINAIEHQLRPSTEAFGLLLPAPAPSAPNAFLPAPEFLLQQPFTTTTTTTTTSSAELNPHPPFPITTPNIALNLTQLESDLAQAHQHDQGQGMDLPSFMDGMGIEEWFSTALLGGMGMGEMQGLALGVGGQGMGGGGEGGGGFHWSTGGGSGVSG